MKSVGLTPVDYSTISKKATDVYKKSNIIKIDVLEENCPILE